MQRNAPGNNQVGATSGQTSAAHAQQFIKVLDGRKHAIRGLWQTKTGRYYAQLRFEDSTTGESKPHRVLLVDKDKRPVTSAAQAVAELARLRTKRADGDSPVLKRTPRFADFVETYLAFIKAGDGTKKALTLAKEEYVLAKWKQEIGGVHLDKIRPFHINQYRKARLTAGAGHSTVNGDLVILRNALKHAKTEGWLKVLPRLEIKPLKTKTPKRPLFTAADLERLCEAAFATKTNEAGEQAPVTKNAQQFVDYVRLLAYCGAREQEALALRWQDVDLDRGQLTIGASGDTKNQAARVVDLNPKLRAHLEDMKVRRAPDSHWVFPSPQRGEKDIHAKSFRESLKLTRRKAGMEFTTDKDKGAPATIKRERQGIAFHDLRHHFISYAVMSGLDFMTIAAWVGHRDGGILIGKVYGHLADSHKKAQAEKLNFGPVTKTEMAGSSKCADLTQ